MKYTNVIIGKNCRIHKTANLGVIAPRLKKIQKLVIGSNGNINSGCTIYTNTNIGANFSSGHNVVIREENSIGNDFSIWSNSVIDYGCKIGNHVKIHCNCYIAQFTVMEDDVFLAPGVIVANDLHPGCDMSAECMKGPILKKGVKIGCNVTLLPYITVGEYSLVGAGSVVTRDVPPYSVVAGNPAKVIKKVWDLKCTTKKMVQKPFNKENYPK